MQIISHRGFWQNYAERNSRVAFERSFDLGFGTETDLRDITGTIVISHDMPHGDEITFEQVLQLMNGRNLPLALNIKADGMTEEILSLLAKYNHTNYFTFDMSVPDLIVQLKHNVRAFTGLSDIIKTPILANRAHGVWLDCFDSDWWTSQDLDNFVSKYGNVCIVSADLHSRNPDQQWTQIKKSKSLNNDNLILCTDYPTKAREFIYGKD